MKLKLILVSLCLFLGGCIHVHEDAPVVKYYRSLNPQYRHHEVRPIRTDGYIGYQDNRGNIHLWPAN